ncbi:MAG: AAA family ATPase [Bacteroidales bacterium]|nr:AAA family ATPase [Candidatus Scybalousia scybalohippi]
MARRWEKKLTDTTVGFEVVRVEMAKKAGYVVVSAKYPTTETIYTYVRKATIKDGEGKTTVDGCDVYFDANTFGVKKVERVYDTAGMRKAVNPGGANKTTTGAIESIKAEMEAKAIEKPVVFPVPSGEIHHGKYETIKSCLECGIPVYLAGPAGSGKNHTVEQIAKELGWDFYFSNSVQQEYKLTGFIDAGGKFHDTEFYKACTSENECVFFLDEMDASIPEVLVLLNAAIANGYFEFPTGRVELEHVHFVAAGNTVGSGADEMYTGRMVLDQATLDRFAIIEFDYSIRIEMAISKNNTDLVSFIRALRDEATNKGIRATFSYRCITMVTKLEKAGMDVEEILKIAVVKGLDKDTVATLRPIGSTRYHEGLRKLQMAA